MADVGKYVVCDFRFEQGPSGQSSTLKLIRMIDLDPRALTAPLRVELQGALSPHDWPPTGQYEITIRMLDDEPA